MDVPQFKSVYSIEDLESLGFHDCYVHGVRWGDHSLMLDLDYILQWTENSGAYNFWVAPAELRFEYVSEAKLFLDWDQSGMECQIHGLYRRDHRLAFNGSHAYRWEIEFTRPQGSVNFWSASFKLSIQAAPVLREVPYLR